MLYTDNAINVLTVRTFPKKGPAWINNNLLGNESIAELCSLLETDEYEFKEKSARIEAAVSRLGSSVDGLVALGDVDFPHIRGNVKPADKPFALFYKVLNPDCKIELTEKIVTAEILKCGATIVSGLALGCDTIAHKTALDHGAKTIAVLPSPLSGIYPKENVALAERIVESGGLLVSEYYDDPKSRNDMVSRFIVRDRLQALFSDAIVLAASYALNNLGNDCGSRHAMGKAKLYGIKRGVIYNEAKHHGNPMFDLNRQILQEDQSVIRIDSTNMREAIQRLVSRPSTLSLF